MNATNSSATGRPRRFGGADLACAALLAALCGVLFFAHLGRTPFYNKGEPREALVVRDIVLNDSWIFPLRGGETIPSKPPLFHWSGALVSKLSGELTEFTVRFPSALFAALGVLCLYGLVSRLHDRETAMFAGLILATTIAYQSEAVEARVDMTLTFFLTLTLLLFYAIHRGILRGERWFYVFYFVLGVGVLAKGPVSLILTVLVIAGFLASKRDWKSLARFGRHPGILPGLAVFCLWYGVAISQGGEGFFGRQLVKENFARFFVHGEGGTGHQKPVYYLIPYLFFQGLPWTLFLPFLAVGLFRDKAWREDPVRFCAIWASAVFVFFSLSAGKRAVYILPLYPPLAWMTALWLRKIGERDPSRGAGPRIVGGVAAVLGLLSLWTALAWSGEWSFGWFSPHYMERWLKPDDMEQYLDVQATIKDLGWFGGALLWGVAGAWLLAARDLFAFRARRVVVELACASFIAGFMAQRAFVPALAAERSYKEFVGRVLHDYPGAGPLYIFPVAADSSSLLFYGGAAARLLAEDYEALRAAVENPAALVVMGESEFDRWRLSSRLPVRAALRSLGSGPDGDRHVVLVRKAAP